MTQHIGRHKINIHNTSRNFWIFEIINPFLDSGHKKLAIPSKYYYAEILMLCLSQRFIYIRSLRKTVTEYLIEMKIFTPQTGKKLALKSFFFAAAIVNLRPSEPAI